MINTKYFIKGFKSVKGIDSPAFALGASFIAIGALLKKFGFYCSRKYFFNIAYLCIARFVSDGRINASWSIIS